MGGRNRYPLRNTNSKANSFTPRGRGKPLTNSTDSQTISQMDKPSTSKPLVVHSPPARTSLNTKLPTTESDLNLISTDPEFLGFTDVEALASEEHLLNLSIEVQNLESNTPIVTNPDTMVNPNDPSPLGTNNVLLESIQEIIRASQTEMRSELTALRSQLNEVRPQTQGTASTNTSSIGFNPSPNPNPSPRIDLEKWKISFDGVSSNVSD